MIKVLQPRMPHPLLLMPYLEKMHAARQYSNNGSLVKRLEERIWEIVEAPVVAVANATQGLELTLRACGIGEGSIVLVPSVTFAASGLAIRAVGAIPLLCDVDPETWTLTPAIVRAMRTSGVDFDAIMPVAAFGCPVLVDAWAQFGVPVIIDAAGALTTQRLETESMMVHAVYSLHATKFIGAGEGGIVASRNYLLRAEIRKMISFQGRGATNAKMSEYHAAVAHASLDCRQTKHNDSMELAAAYARQLPVGWKMQSGAIMDRVLMPVLAPDAVSAENLASYLLHVHDIQTKQWYRPFLHEIGQLDRHIVCDHLPVTQMLIERMVGLPFHLFMTLADVTTVTDALREYDE